MSKLTLIALAVIISATAQDRPLVFQVGAELVVLDVIATDANGREVSDLTTAEELLGLGPGHATVGLLGTTADGPGLAALVLDPRVDTGSRGPSSMRMQAFGPGGEAAIDRLRAACAAWEAADRPTSANLRLTVVPVGRAVPPTTQSTVVVGKEHCRVLVEVTPP